jgi:hypothetical protein
LLEIRASTSGVIRKGLEDGEFLIEGGGSHDIVER